MPVDNANQKLINENFEDRIAAMEQFADLFGTLSNQLAETQRILRVAKQEDQILRQTALLPGDRSNDQRADVGPPFPDRLLSTKDVIQRLGVTRQTIWRLRKAGKFPNPVKVTVKGRLMRYSLQEFEDWLGNQHTRNHN